MGGARLQRNQKTKSSDTEDAKDTEEGHEPKFNAEASSL